jgi:hypothetical protein
VLATTDETAAAAAAASPASGEGVTPGTPEAAVSPPGPLLPVKGYMHKVGGRVRNWKRRWFELDPTERVLRYFAPPNDSVLKGTIRLDEVSEVRPSSTCSQDPDIHVRVENFWASGFFRLFLTDGVLMCTGLFC